MKVLITKSFQFWAATVKSISAHVKRLAKSFESNYLKSPITVNEKLEIIDGQHLFEAAKLLGLPIYYFVAEKYGLSEVRILNTHGVNWGTKDYQKTYTDLGYKGYVALTQFMSDYPEFGQTVSIHLVSLHYTRDQDKLVTGANNKTFQKGEFVVPDIEKSYEYAARLLEIKEIAHNLTRWKSRLFVLSVMGVWAKPEFDHERFMRKLKERPSRLSNCLSTKEYRNVFDAIYNGGIKDKAKVLDLKLK